MERALGQQRRGDAGVGPWGGPIVVFLFALAVFLPALAAGFIDLDDFALLVDNDKWRGLGIEQIKWMFTTTLLGHYQPLTWVSFGFNFVVGGMDPAGYHAVNIVLHAANAVLVYFVALRLIGAAGARPGAVALTAVQQRLGAGIGAMLWAVHPLRVESVAWVTERRDVLSTFFLLGALLAYLRMAELSPAGDKRGRGWIRFYVLSVGLLLLSLLSKTWGMSFFAIVLLLDCYPLGRLPALPWLWLKPKFLPVALEKVPFAVLGAAFAVVIGRAFASEPMAMKTLQQWPLTARFVQAAYGLVFYLWKTVIPSGLAPLYTLPERVDPLAGKYLVCYAVLLASAGFAIGTVRRVPAIACVAVVYVILLAPVLGFFQSGDQFVADRYSYVASIGWSLLVGAGFALAVRWAVVTGKFKPGVIRAAGAGVLLALGMLTLRQASVWRNSMTLWQHAVEAGVTTADVRINYGLNLEREARDPDPRAGLSDADLQALMESAAEQFRLATQSRPDNGRAWYCLGNAAKALRKFDEADKAFEQAARHLPQAYMALVNRGRLLIEQLNRRDEGIACLRSAVADIERPRTGAEAGVKLSGRPYLALGSALWNAGEQAEARAVLRKGLGFDDSRDAAAAQLRAIGETP